MELLNIEHEPLQFVEEITHEVVSSSSFIEANTEPVQLKEMRDRHVIPVFLKDNEPTISHTDFIHVIAQACQDSFGLTELPQATIRVSHPVKGRTYQARLKRAQDLLDSEKTIYYERMAFMITIPGIRDEISGNILDLTVGGVKSYQLDNLNNCKGSQEHFKIFIGFKNRVCTNLCVSTDGTKLDLKVRSPEELFTSSMDLIAGFDPIRYLRDLTEFEKYELQENQFAQIIGRCRLYQFLPKVLRNEIPQLLINDTQVSRIAESFYLDQNFSRNDVGTLDLWRFFNLFTGANKQSYVDKYIERGVNGFEFTNQVKQALDSPNSDFWYLS